MQEKLLRLILTAVLKLFFRVEVRGREHYEHVRDRGTVIIANHQSFLDPLLLSVFLPEKPVFAMNVFQAEKWFFKPLLKLVKVFPVDPTQPMSTKSIIAHLKEQKAGKVVVFPEGRITVTGGIMKVYEGTGMIAEHTGSILLPIRIEGAQHSIFSKLKGKEWQSAFPKITLTFMPPQELNLPDEVKGKDRRSLAAQRIYDMLCDAAFYARSWNQPLLGAIMQAAEHDENGSVIISAPPQEKLTYKNIFTRSFVLSAKLSKRIDEGRSIGVLLPTSPAGVITFLALHMLNRVPAMLNFSAGEHNILQACNTAQVRTVITSRAFIEKGKLEELAEAISREYTLIYLEDIRPSVRLLDKLVAMLQYWMLSASIHKITRMQKPDDPAVILFTSGSEGSPKGVVLSHKNLLSNIAQVASRLSFTSNDVMFNALPIFHSFGLTGGTLLPLVLGFRTYLYPSPLHYRVVPEAIYDSNATFVLGTDTFYNGYARYANPYDFYSVRIAVAGAEKLKEKTRQLYAEKFNVNIYEGYGVTETAPVLSVNTPLEHEAGTVGRLLPGIEYRLEKVEGLEQGGKLLVRGPNIMLGYLKADRPGELQPEGEWYDTGDIVDIDVMGYIRIVGRAKRFAKVGGEMVSLAVVEDCAADLWHENAHAALAVPDERKGEVVVLFTEQEDATRDDFLQHAQSKGLPEISFPKKVVFMVEIPRLGSGKVDYMTLKARVSEHS